MTHEERVERAEYLRARLDKETANPEQREALRLALNSLMVLIMDECADREKRHIHQQNILNEIRRRQSKGTK